VPERKGRWARLAGLAFWLAILLTAAFGAACRSPKAAGLSTTLAPTSLPQWLSDLGYQDSDIYPLSVTTGGCPLVDVGISGVSLALMLDTGTARGFVLTTAAPTVPHRVEGRNEALNADGTHRGESYRIRVEALSVLGAVFKNVAGGLSDWRMYSSEPFNGTVGLDFFSDRRLTLDYHERKVAVTSAPLPEKLDSGRYITLDLISPPKWQGRILYVRARVAGRESIVYVDTGYSVSFIDPGFAQGLHRVVRTGRFRVFRESVPVVLGGQRLTIDEVRESRLDRGAGLDDPVAMTLGSDVLAHFVVTIDLRARKLILARAG
jgi:hypothetical protein